MLKDESVQFFRELRLNNHKEWFDANRARYELVKKDYQQWVGQLLDDMKQVDPDLFHLQVKDCTFRINRDIRFSKDKTPYKTHLGVIMSPHGRRLEGAGYYVHLDEQNGSFAGGGIWMPSGEVLKKVRREISVFYEDLLEILEDKDFKRVYGELDRTDDILLTRPPKGYDADDPAIEFLKMKSFTASKTFSTDILTDAKGKEKIVDALQALKPLVQFLNRALKTD